MTTDHKQLRALAEKATPGEWTHHEENGFPYVLGPHDETLDGPVTVVDGSENLSVEDSAFIAAANPQTVIALLDDLDESRRLVGTWQAHSVEAADRRSEALGQVARLEIQLAAVTAARDEACEMIQKLVDAQARYSPPAVAESSAFAAMKREIDRRIAELRKVGAK